MKKSIWLFLLIIACDLPSEPTGIKVVYEYHEETEDFCRGLDVLNGVLVAAASSNGYFRYNILNENLSPTLKEVVHIQDVNPNVGDDSVFDVIISNNAKDMAIILDDVDNILIEDFSTSTTEVISQNPCGNSLLYRSIAVNDDTSDSTILFTLQKHFDVVPVDYNTYSTSIGIREYFTELTPWDPFETGDTTWTETFISNPGCLTLANPDIEAMKLFYADDILSVTQGPYIQLYKFNKDVSLTETFEDANNNSQWDYLEDFDDLNEDGYWDENEFFDDCGYVLEYVDQNDNGLYDVGEPFEPALNLVSCSGDPEDLNNDGLCCGSTEDDFLPPDGSIDHEVFTDHNNDGICCGDYIGNNLDYLGHFYLQGGEASCSFSAGDVVIGGFSNYRGCYMALLDSDGVVIDKLTFADGYSISAISYDEQSPLGILAVGAGNSGVILYNWNGGMSVSLKGIIDLGDNNYVYDVKVVGSNIYVGSENGISIYKIEG